MRGAIPLSNRLQKEVKLILKRDKEHLEFIREYNLNTKPLEVDLLVIKKPVGYRVGDEIGRIFSEYYIVEYQRCFITNLWL